MISQGTYHTQPNGSIRTDTHWLPGGVTNYEFEVRDSKLTCSRVKPQRTLLQKLNDSLPWYVRFN